MKVNKENVRKILQFFFEEGENANQEAENVNGVYFLCYRCMSPVVENFNSPKKFTGMLAIAASPRY